jgi:hypothetical protein
MYESCTDIQKKNESPEAYLNRELATISAKDYVGWNANCA